MHLLIIAYLHTRPATPRVPAWHVLFTYAYTKEHSNMRTRGIILKCVYEGSFTYVYTKDHSIMRTRRIVLKCVHEGPFTYAYTKDYSHMGYSKQKCSPLCGERPILLM